MIPETYNDFFVTTATVAGALVGLLFVAISVRPQAAARTAPITTRLRALAALSAFLNPLFLSLLALRPTDGFGEAVLILGLLGLGVMVGLLVLLVAQGRERRWQSVRDGILLVGQAVVYAIEVVDGVQLMDRPEDVGLVDGIAILFVVLFAIGVARAWEFVGADNPSLVAAVARVSRPRASPPDTDGDG